MVTVDVQTFLQILSLLVAGVLVPILLTVRREAREAIHALRGDIHKLAVQVAHLEERARLLDERDPRA